MCFKKQLLAASLLIFSVSWLLPNHYEPWGSIYQELLAFLACFVIVLVSAFLERPTFPLKFSIFFLVSLYPFVQLFTRTVYFSGDSWVVFFYLFSFGAILLASYNIAKSNADKKLLVSLFAWSLVISSLISTWIALRQWLLFPGNIWTADLPLGGRPFANLAQPNSLSTILCVGMASVLYLYEKYRLGHFSAGLISALLIFGVALTQSRTPWVSSLFAIFFLVWKAKFSKLRLSPGMLLVWFCLYIILVLLLPKFSELLQLSSSNPLERAQSLERLALWYQLWQAVLHGPIWGYGWNQVSVAQVGVTADYPARIMVEHSHNILLDLLIWNGPILGGLLIFLVGGWLVRLYWQAKSTESVLALLAVGFVLIHAMLEFPLEYAYFLFPVGLLLGLASAEHRPRRELNLPRWFLVGVLVIGVGMFGWVWREYRILEEDYRLMRFETARIGTLKAEQAAPDVVLLTQLREFIRFVRTEAREGMNDDELDWMRKVAHRYPYPPSLFRYSLALGLNGKSAEGYRQMLILQSLHPIMHFEEGANALRLMEEKYPQLRELNDLLKKQIL